MARRAKDPLKQRRGAAARRPSCDEARPLALREIPVPAATAIRLGTTGPGEVRCYRLGECTVIVTREFGKWHLSIAHHDRAPTWNEIAQARYRLLPNHLTIVMPLPPKEHYVNLHPNCFQMFEIDGSAARMFAPDEAAEVGAAS